MSTTSTVSTVTSGTQENTGSLPAVIGGLIAAITVQENSAVEMASSYSG